MNHLKHYRMKKNLRQIELSLAADVSLGMISLTECNKIIPSIRLKKNLAKALDVDVDVLFPKKETEDAD